MDKNKEYKCERCHLLIYSKKKIKHDDKKYHLTCYRKMMIEKYLDNKIFDDLKQDEINDILFRNTYPKNNNFIHEDVKRCEN